MEKRESKLFVKEKKKKKELIDKSKQKKYLCDHKIEEDLCVKAIDEDNKIVKCKLCGTEFRIDPISTPEIKEAIKTIKNVLNCIKIKGEYRNRAYLPLEVRNQFSTMELFFDALPEIYKELYVEKINNKDEEEHNSYSFGYNGALELSSNGGPIIGGATNFKKKKKHKDVTSLLGEKKNKNKKKKKKNNNSWY